MRKLPFALLLILPLVSFSQSTWRKGNVVMKDGTTVEGLIKDQEWNTNPKTVEFQKEGQAAQTFSTEDIVSFNASSPVRYEAHQVEYDGDDQATHRLPESKEPGVLTKENLFLKVIVNGQIGLLQFVDKNSRLHFFIKMDGTVRELLFRNYKVSVAAIGANERFKQQLFLITNDCQKLQPRIKSLDYNEGSLAGIFRQINECKGYSVTPVWTGEAEARKKANMGVTALVFWTKTEFTFVISNMSTANFGGGIFYEVYSKKRPNRVSLYNELVYKNVNQTGFLPSYPTNVGTLQFYRIKLINCMRFSYPSSRGRIFWGVGIANGMRSKATFTDIKNTSPDTEVEHEAEPEIGFIVSAGKTFVIGRSSKLTAELRYELEQWPAGSSDFIGSHNLGLSIQATLK